MQITVLGTPSHGCEACLLFILVDKLCFKFYGPLGVVQLVQCLHKGWVAPQGHINQCGGHPWLHMFSRSTKDAFYPVSKISLIQCNIFMYYLDAHFIIHMLFVMNLTIGNNLIVQQLGNDMSTRVYLLFQLKYCEQRIYNKNNNYHV